ncbi:MAG: hypothetical protein K8T20_08550 [Planctomycetes bacterium]|nr:hypothetical protein [Planctomycetota bacterium]
METLTCGKCGADLGPVQRRKAFISVFVYGDEETRSWYFCGACRVWMVEEYLDVFIGDSRVAVRGPFPEGACEADVALAKTCPAPGDKWCECPAHKKLGPG